MSERIRVDELLIEVRRSSRRRTVDLTVDRFGDIVIAVPALLPKADIEKVVLQKRLWIYKTLRRKEKALHHQHPSEYVTGEGFYYLGRKYRLKVFEPDGHLRPIPSLQLRNGRFMLKRDAASKGREHFLRWYADKARNKIVDEVNLLKERVGVEPKSIRVRDLKFRWGSCTSKGNLYFHWRIVMLPADLVRYLVLHELVHLREHNHSEGFYERLAMVVPDFREREAWLEGNGDRYTL